MKEPKYTSISVCIATFQRDDALLNSLSELSKSSFVDFEILILDNGQSKALPGLLETLPVKQPLQLVQASENLGCANLNRLFQKARGQIVVCFDDDSYPAEDCLENAYRAFQSNPELGMIGFKMHTPETGEPWHDPWWNPEETEVKATVFCIGCGMAFRRDSRLPVDLCIPDIVSQAHELSIAAEILRLGYAIEFHPECRAYHPDTGTGYTGKKAESGNLNQLRFLLRYSDPKSLRLIRWTHRLLRLRGMPHNCAFIRDYLHESPRMPLSRPLMQKFHTVLDWHLHPRLKLFAATPSPKR